MEEKIIDQLIALAEGKLKPSEWKEWFAENAKEVEKICGRTKFLGIKPSSIFSDVRNIYHSQQYAIKWLQSKNISYNSSDCYEQEYEKEFKEFCRKEEEKNKRRRNQVEQKYGYLKEVYPKFFRQLKKSFDEYTILKNENDNHRIQSKEQELNIIFSEELRTFFTLISTFEYEGIRIEFNDIEIGKFDEKEYLILGEFWKYGDGDKLLYDIEKHSIHIFAHDTPQIFKESKTMTDFMEKSIVKHLKEYEE